MKPWMIRMITEMNTKFKKLNSSTPSVSIPVIRGKETSVIQNHYEKLSETITV
jgi:hypothetical protein